MNIWVTITFLKRTPLYGVIQLQCLCYLLLTACHFSVSWHDIQHDFSLKGNKLCWVGKFTFILRNDKFVGFTTWSWKNFFYCNSLSFFWLPWNCTSVHTFQTLCESCKKFGLPTMSCRKNFVSYLHWFCISNKWICNRILNSEISFVHIYVRSSTTETHIIYILYITSLSVVTNLQNTQI